MIQILVFTHRCASLVIDLWKPVDMITMKNLELNGIYYSSRFIILSSANYFIHWLSSIALGLVHLPNYVDLISGSLYFNQP